MKYDAVEVCCVKCHAVLCYTSSPCTMIQVVLYRAEEGNARGAVLALASLCSCKPVQTESSDDINFAIVCPLSTVPSSSTSCIVLLELPCQHSYQTSLDKGEGALRSKPDLRQDQVLEGVNAAASAAAHACNELSRESTLCASRLATDDSKDV